MPSRNGQRECGCPPHIKACVHFDDTALALCDVTLVADCEYRVPLPSRFVVSTMRGRWATNAPWCEHPSFKGKTLVAPFNTDDLPAALAEFDRRAEAMRLAE